MIDIHSNFSLYRMNPSPYLHGKTVPESKTKHYRSDKKSTQAIDPVNALRKDEREAWHHHMALVMMIMRFMLQDRKLQANALPLLSCADIEKLLAYFLTKKNASINEMFRQLKYRHQHQQQAIDSHTIPNIAKHEKVGKAEIGNS